jgi:hypothetical protein
VTCSGAHGKSIHPKSKTRALNPPELGLAKSVLHIARLATRLCPSSAASANDHGVAGGALRCSFNPISRLLPCCAGFRRPMDAENLRSGRFLTWVC